MQWSNFKLDWEDDRGVVVRSWRKRVDESGGLGRKDRKELNLTFKERGKSQVLRANPDGYCKVCTYTRDTAGDPRMYSLCDATGACIV